MATGTINVSAQIGGLNFSAKHTRTGTGSSALDSEDVVAGAAGELGAAAVVAMVAGHGIEEDDPVVAFWDGGVRYGCTAVSVGAETLTLDGGAGDALPAEGTDLVIGKTVEMLFAVPYSPLEMIVLAANKRVHVELQESDDTLQEAVEIEADGQWHWVADTGPANPFAADVHHVQVACGETTAAKLNGAALFDATP